MRVVVIAMMMMASGVVWGQTVQDEVAAIINFEVDLRLAEKCYFRSPLWTAQRLVSSRKTALFVARRQGLPDAYVYGAERQAEETAESEATRYTAVVCSYLTQNGGALLKSMDALQ